MAMPPADHYNDEYDFVLVGAKGQSEPEPVMMFRVDLGDCENTNQLIMVWQAKNVMLVVQVDGTGDEPLFWLGPIKIPPGARPLGGPDVTTDDLLFVETLVDAPLCEEDDMAFPMRLFDKESLCWHDVLGPSYRVLAPGPRPEPTRKRKRTPEPEAPNKRPAVSLPDLFVSELREQKGGMTTGELLKASALLRQHTPGATLKAKRHELNRSGGVVDQLKAAGRITGDQVDRRWTVTA